MQGESHMRRCMYRRQVSWTTLAQREVGHLDMTAWRACISQHAEARAGHGATCTSASSEGPRRACEGAAPAAHAVVRATQGKVPLSLEA